MAGYRVIHRFVPAGLKHGNKTACGIGLVDTDPMAAPGTDTMETPARNGGYISVTKKGVPFDCDRCRSVLELFRKGRINA